MRRHLKFPSSPHNLNTRNGHSQGLSFAGRVISTLMDHLATVFRTARKNFTESSMPLYHRSTHGTECCPRFSGTQENSLHLLVCKKDCKPTPDLYQEEISKLKNDRQLFDFLREDYLRHRRKTDSRMSLRAPESVSLIKVFRVFFFYNMILTGTS